MRPCNNRDTIYSLYNATSDNISLNRRVFVFPHRSVYQQFPSSIYLYLKLRTMGLADILLFNAMNIVFHRENATFFLCRKALFYLQRFNSHESGHKRQQIVFLKVCRLNRLKLQLESRNRYICAVFKFYNIIAFTEYITCLISEAYVKGGLTSVVL